MIARYLSFMLRWIVGDWMPDRSVYIDIDADRIRQFSRLGE